MSKRIKKKIISATRHSSGLLSDCRLAAAKVAGAIVVVSMLSGCAALITRRTDFYVRPTAEPVVRNCKVDNHYRGFSLTGADFELSVVPHTRQTVLAVGPAFIPILPLFKSGQRIDQITFTIRLNKKENEDSLYLRKEGWVLKLNGALLPAVPQLVAKPSGEYNEREDSWLIESGDFEFSLDFKFERQKVDSIELDIPGVARGFTRYQVVIAPEQNFNYWPLFPVMRPNYSCPDSPKQNYQSL